MKTPAILLSIALALVAASLPSRADNKEDARAHVAAADTHFKLGEFAAALDEYSKAYELFPAPPLLFNLGQCHRQLKHWDRAIFFFEGYLRERPDAPNRGVVEDLLREAHQELDAQLTAEAAQKARDDEAARTRAAEEVEQRRLDAEAERRRADADAERRARDAEELRRVEAARVERERQHEDKLVRKWWFWSAVGGAALAIGGTAYYFSGATTIVEPSGSLGGLDRR
jgi:tetratricopeptide (TPR) repeat protein